MKNTARRASGANEPQEEGKLSKKWEILEGARRVFRAEGFDGASMDKIAHAAGVSKGTLYVYFHNKEELFKELVLVDRKEAAEQVCKFDGDQGEVREVLQRLGESFVAMMTKPEHIALIRMVMGAAEKFPEAGRVFFENGPSFGIRRLAAYLEQQVEAGKLQIDDDLELAAVHFFNLCQGNLTKPMLFSSGDPPSSRQIKATVASAVRIFMRAYDSKASALPKRVSRSR